LVKNTKHIELKALYIKNKSFDDEYFKKLMVDYITKFGKASHGEINELLNNKLSDALNEKQRFDKITNLLSALKRKKKIVFENHH